ncbi:hypothetical protein MMC25_003807 [Agyrium rufum]|nr:hypothetical protein [Agyrium rufum]
MASASKPTIVLIQGCFQTPEPYEKVENLLRSQGFAVIHPALPSCSDPDRPDFASITLVDDALAVRMELTRLIEYERKTVFVVMHSYGGLVGGEGIPIELSYSHRKSQDLPGGVIHLFFYSAFMLQPNTSILGVFGELPTNEVKPNGRFRIRDGEKTLYNDLPEDEARKWVSRMIDQSHAVQNTEVTRASYQYIPSTYLVCENDQACPAQFQEMFAAQAKSEVQRCSTGHSAMLSQPEMLADRIVAAIEKAI